MPTRTHGIRILLILLAAAVVGGLAVVGVVYVTLLRDLPDMQSVDEYQPPLTSQVLDREGRLIGEFYEERRALVPYEQIPRHVVLAFVAGEDAAFFEHEGIDYMGILRAAWVNLAAGGEVKQGGSTITQQTVKSLLLTPERKIQRKIKELILARRLEQRLSKEDILYLYLNQIYFGQGAWGIEEAARTYFGKSASELDLSEAALLAGLPQRPSDYSPTSNPRAAERRRRYVLQRMRVEGFVDEETFREALESPPELRPWAPREDARVAAYFVEEVRRRLYDTVGSDLVLRGGITVETTLDLELQTAATEAVRSGLEQLDRRQGWRGPEKTISPENLEAAIAELGKLNELVPEPEAPDETEALEGEAELEAIALEPPPAEPEPIAPPTDRPLRGVVTAVDAASDTARVAFAPEVEATVRLADVKWARKPDPSRRAHSVRNIESVFQTGQAASFRILPDESDVDGKAAPGRKLYATIAQTPLAEGALLSFDVETGGVRALVGGYDYRRSEFDRATQARRQAGSAFKPLIYAAALEKDYTPASILVDRPVVYEDPESGFVWRPQNYSRKFLGRLPMREALARSVNNATIHLFRDLRVNNVIEFARRLGVESLLARDLSLALGSSSVTLLEMTRAYAVFPSSGRQVLPVFITNVVNREGESILGPQVLGTIPEVPEWRPDERPTEDEELARIVENLEADGEQEGPLARRKQVISPQLAYLATDLLRAAVFDPHGTGRGARELGRKVGGKTGTTNFGGDAWFIGFSPDVVTGVWVGYDEKRVLGKGETGGRTALPIWRDYMRDALKEYPARDFPVPSGIVFARVDPETGMLAGAGTEKGYLQAFAQGTEPTQTAKQASRSGERGRLLRLDEF